MKRNIRAAGRVAVALLLLFPTCCIPTASIAAPGTYQGTQAASNVPLASGPINHDSKCGGNFTNCADQPWAEFGTVTVGGQFTWRGKPLFNVGLNVGLPIYSQFVHTGMMYRCTPKDTNVTGCCRTVSTACGSYNLAIGNSSGPALAIPYANDQGYGNSCGS